MDKSLKDLLDKIPFDLSNYINKNTTEIRIRCGCNIFHISDGVCSEIPDSILTQKQVYNILLDICDNTLSAFETRISQGYITIAGGHRIGIGGKFYAVNNTYFISEVYSLNVRINNQKLYFLNSDVLSFSKGLLIAGPPHSGKTTLLKSLILNLGGIIAVCDERNEMFIQGACCDYISGIPKHKAIEQATRCMNPDIIICDEIGDKDEAIQILSSVNSGVRFICSVHCDSMQSLYKKPNAKLLLDSDVFDKIVFLACNAGKFFIKEVIDV